MQQKSVNLTARQWKEMTSESKRMGVSVSEYLRRIIDAARAIRVELLNEPAI